MPAGNYGWRPDLEPGRYIEAVPMTDPDRVPGAREAVWSSGTPHPRHQPRIVPPSAPGWGDCWSGAARGSETQQGREGPSCWGFDPGRPRGRAGQASLARRSRYGRIRTVSGQNPHGALFVTTDNGGTDRLLRVTPGDQAEVVPQAEPRADRIVHGRSGASEGRGGVKRSAARAPWGRLSWSVAAGLFVALFLLDLTGLSSAPANREVSDLRTSASSHRSPGASRCDAVAR